MDIKVNSVNFSGKKEILYGLKKAADNVHSYSLYQQPRILRLGENKCVDKYKAAAKAYLDMVTKDTLFENYADSFKQKDLQPIQELLKPIEHINVKPFEYFTDFLDDVMMKNGTNSHLEGAARALLDKLV